MALSNEVWVITGASKGIGAALVSQILKKEETVVFALARRPDLSTSLNESKRDYGGRLHLVKVDVSDESTIQAAVNQVTALEGKVDVIVNNAAIIESFNLQTHEVTSQDYRDVLGTNVVGAHNMIRAFYNLMQHSKIKKIINMSSVAGSVSTWAALVQGEKDSALQGFKDMQPAYRASKAAFNSVTISWALELSPDSGFKIIALHPGLVSSDTVLGGFRQLGMNVNDLASAMEVLTPEDSARKIIDIIQGLEKGDSGSFIDYKGNTLPF